MRKKMKILKKDQINLECPECSEDNIVKLSSELKCKKCEKTLLGFNYKRFLLPTIAVVGLSGAAGAIIDDTVNLNRVSVKTEYKIMRTCINSFYDRETCFCAVESMSGLVDAQKAKLYGDKWLKDLLHERYNDCKD
jgi:transposase-like protein